jgi:serine/threonine protein kinase
MAITVDGNTRLSQLQDLTSNANDAGSKLRAKHNDQGDLVLYVKDGKTSFLDKVLNRAERREERAMNAVQTIFNNEIGLVGQQKTGAKYLEETATVAGKLRVAAVHTLASNIGEVLDMLPPRGAAKSTVKPGTTGLGLRELGVTTSMIHQSGNDLSDASADKLGDSIATAYRGKAGVGPEDRHAFGRSGAMRLREELTAIVTTKLGANDRIAPFVDAAVNRAVSQMLPDRAVADTSTTINGHVLPNVTIGGQEFAPTKFLGGGAFGQAFEYQSIDDPSAKIALKLPLPALVDTPETKAGLVEDFAQEAAMHRKAQGEGDAHLLGLKGEIRFPDGTLGLAMEVAPNGDAHTISKSIGEMVKNGSMTTAEANALHLTMIKDMALGLQHMAGLDVQHLDFKSSNCFIGSDGTAKVADFGLTASGKEVKMSHFREIPSWYYSAPEIPLNSEAVAKEGKEYQQGISKAARDRVKELFPSMNGNTVSDIVRSVFSADNKAEQSRIVATAKEKYFLTSAADAWGLGASAIEMLTGFLPFDSSAPGSQTASSHLDYYSNNPTLDPLADGRDVDGRPQNGSVGVKTGDKAIDDLLTGLLRADPKTRFTADDVLKSAALQFPGVGSDQARALIAAIGSGKGDAIETAKANLLWSMI